MDERFFRAFYEAIRPKGEIWTAATEKGLDNFLAALSAIKSDVSDFLTRLAEIRRPEPTPYLDELEAELGVLPNPTLSEEERREYLKVLRLRRGNIKNAELLEEILRELGFDVYVHINNPPVDPDKFVFEAFKTICGNPNAICGNPNAICGGEGGELLVNGDVLLPRKIYLMIAGGVSSICGSSELVCGSLESREWVPVIYEVPDDPGYWGLFFFVGGTATRDIDGKLIDIQPADVPYIRRTELIRLILNYKPLHSWAGLVLKYI